MSRPAERDTRVPAVIGAFTGLSGIGLMLLPRVALRLVVGARDEPPAPHLFRLVGMFMGVCGGLLVDGRADRVVLRWGVAQKAGAVAGVGLGVASGDFHRRALFVAAVDAISALLLVRALRSRSPS